MAEPETADDKEHEPSQRKLEEARRKGDLAKSNDLLTFAALSGLLLAALVIPSTLNAAFNAAKWMIQTAPDLAVNYDGGKQAAVSEAIFTMLQVALVALCVPAISVVLMLVAQRGLVFAPDRLKPKLSRVSILANARHKFGADGLFEFAKSGTKLILVSGTLVFVLWDELDPLVASANLSPFQGLNLLWGLLGTFLFAVTFMTLLLGAADLLWQRHALIKRNRMSRKELVDESREQEGDPHTKSTRRQRAQQIALNQMLAEVSGAAVVIVNPTHYAVALKWTRGSQTPPILVAKGVDEIALRIRARAAEAGVPIHPDAPTARAIHASVPIGEPIRHQHFAAVAIAIRFAEKLRKEARK